MSDTTWMHEAEEAGSSKKVVPTTPERAPAQLVRKHLFGTPGHDYFTDQFQSWARDGRIYGLVVSYVETGEVPGSDVDERRANAGTLATLTGLDWGQAAEIAELFSRYRKQVGLTVAEDYRGGYRGQGQELHPGIQRSEDPARAGPHGDGENARSSRADREQYRLL